MNNQHHENTPIPVFSFEPDDLTMIDPLFDDADALGANIQPTPINPSKIVPVDSVSIQATFWNPDHICYESLKKLATRPDHRFVTQNDGIPISRMESNVSVVSDGTSGDESPEYTHSFRQSQVELWNQRYIELLDFYKEHNHCRVPLRYERNPNLSHWVKRQRYQYRMKKEGQHSTLNNKREAALESLGFVWDSHAEAWTERWNELKDFRDVYGHCNVPKTYTFNRQLAIWVKSQRRHYRLHEQGKKTPMTRERIIKLLQLGFDFHPRSRST